MKKFSFIFLSLTHGFINDFEKQKELINEIKPEIVLSEQVEDKKFISQNNYESFLERKEFSLMTPFIEVKDLVEICFEKNIKLIGIDFENYGFSDEICHKINNSENLTKEEEIQIEEIVKKREEEHLRRIFEYEGKSSKPILIFMGAWHLRKEGLIRKNFKNSKFILLKDSKGNEVYEPTEEEINYGEINL